MKAKKISKKAKFNVSKGAARLKEDLRRDLETKFYILWAPSSTKPPTVKMWTKAQAMRAADRMVRRTGMDMCVMESVAFFTQGKAVSLSTFRVQAPGVRYEVTHPNDAAGFNTDHASHYEELLDGLRDDEDELEHSDDGTIRAMKRAARRGGLED